MSANEVMFGVSMVLFLLAGVRTVHARILERRTERDRRRAELRPAPSPWSDPPSGPQAGPRSPSSTRGASISLGPECSDPRGVFRPLRVSTGRGTFVVRCDHWALRRLALLTAPYMVGETDEQLRELDPPAVPVVLSYRRFRRLVRSGRILVEHRVDLVVRDVGERDRAARGQHDGHDAGGGGDDRGERFDAAPSGPSEQLVEELEHVHASDSSKGVA